jgi:hypothetical protein
MYNIEADVIETVNCVKKIGLKNVVFWDVTPCGYSKNERFGGT